MVQGRHQVLLNILSLLAVVAVVAAETVAAAAERHVTAVLETADGPLPEPQPHYFQRFGGLAEPDAHPRPRPDTREKTP